MKMTRSQYAKRAEKLRDAANDLTSELREIAEELQDDFDDKSERWQESEKGQGLQSFIDAIGEAADAFEDAEVPEFPT
jgi:uncharacterized protein YukE